MAGLVGFDENGLLSRAGVKVLTDSGIASSGSVEQVAAKVDRSTRTDAARRRVSYPSYWWASYYQPRESDTWADTLSDPSTVGFVIVNPNSGPGETASSDWQVQMDVARASGATVLGYVSSDYANAAIARDGSRTPENIIAEIQSYVEWYGIDGVFLDEVSNGWSEEQADDHVWYGDLVRSLRGQFPELILVGNAGTNTRRDYAEMFDVLVTFEGTAERYLTTEKTNLLPSDYQGIASTKFWHMVHDVESREQATAVLSLASEVGAGHIYLTDDSNTHEPPAMWGNPYDVPPASWLLGLQRDWARYQSSSDPELTPRVAALEKRISDPLIRHNHISIIGDSFSSTGYGSNYGHIWHTIAMAHANAVLVGNYAQNGHTALDALEGRTSDWSPDPENSQVTRAEKDASNAVIICLGYNDQNNSVPQSEYEESLAQMVKRISQAGKLAIVMEPPIPLSARASAIPELEKYVSGLRRVAETNGGTFLPTWDLVGDRKGVSSAWDQGDGSHLKAEGHDAFGLAVAPRLMKVVNSLGEYAGAIRTPAPISEDPQVMVGDKCSATVIDVPQASRDIFPSGKAMLFDLGVSADPYVSVGYVYKGENLGGSFLRLTFSYEVVSVDENRVKKEEPTAGLYVQSGTFNPWKFDVVWGGVKLNTSRGVASVLVQVPENLNEWVFAFTFWGIERIEGDSPAQVRVGSARVEEVI